MIFCSVSDSGRDQGERRQCQVKDEEDRVEETKQLWPEPDFFPKSSIMLFLIFVSIKFYVTIIFTDCFNQKSSYIFFINSSSKFTSRCVHVDKSTIFTEQINAFKNTNVHKL